MRILGLVLIMLAVGGWVGATIESYHPEYCGVNGKMILLTLEGVVTK
jgi:hypothetical protein